LITHAVAGAFAEHDKVELAFFDTVATEAARAPTGVAVAV
jgi:hypothetical protein